MNSSLTLKELTELAKLRGVIDSLEEAVDQVMLTEGTQNQKWAQIGALYCSIRHMLKNDSWNQEEEGTQA
jgi:hypothetical protein